WVGIRLNPERAEGLEISILFSVAEEDQDLLVSVRHCTINVRKGLGAGSADIEVRCTRTLLNDLLLGQISVDSFLAELAVEVTGRDSALREFLGCLDDFSRVFAVMEP